MSHSLYYHPSLDVPRKIQRKRFPASKPSSETIQIPPEYSSPPGWNSTCDPLTFSESDQPPDYPETADEADADTEEDQEERTAYVQYAVAHPLPRRSHTHTRRRERARATGSDPFIDALLERSVHALEMSNALLRTTMSAQSSLSALLSSENESDHFLEVRARNLSTRIRVNSGVHETWMEHLKEISDGVDKLFEEDGRGHTDKGAVSRSLPTTPVPALRHRRKPSILELHGPMNPQLQYSYPTRDALVAPAPRALTQYTEFAGDPCLMMLPSTMGLRTPGSSHSVQSEESLCMRRQETELALTADNSFGTQPESDTSAYHLLSNLVKRSGSLTPPPSRLLHSRDRCVSPSLVAKGQNTIFSFPPSPIRALYASLDRSQSGSRLQTSSSCSEAFCIPSIPSSPLYTMPPEDDHSPSSSESSDRPTGYRTVQSLRKILNDHPSSTSVNTFQRNLKLRRPPAFLPITPPPAPTQGTSTATASISRLYTKGRHSMSTRPPSPPTHSSLKVHSVPPTPSPSPSTMSLSDVFGNGVARVVGNATSSRASTPKRISFAELPESYSGSQPGTSKLRERKNRKKSKLGKGNDKEEVGDWLKTFWRGGFSSGGLIGMGNREERVEERLARGWGNRLGYGTLDDWAV